MAKVKIDNLTIGEAKKRMDESLSEYLELTEMFNTTPNLPNKETSSISVSQQGVGQYVIIRSRNEGVNCGKVAAADHTGVILEDARRMWWHKPAVKSESWYEGVANHGPSDDTKLSGAVSRKIIIEDYSMTICSSKAETALRSKEPHSA